MSRSERKDGVIPDHLGRFGCGSRNENGKVLLGFIIKNDLFACNTGFQHPCRHRTTRVGKKPIPKSQRKKLKWRGKDGTINTYVQIDFVLCRTTSKCLLEDSRAYENPRVVLDCDHRPVITHVNLSNHVLMYKKKKPQTERCDIQKLLTDRDSKEEYAKKIESELHKLDTDKPADIRLEDLFNVVTTSAKATLGIVKRTVKKGYYNDPELLRLVEKRKELRRLEYSDNRPVSHSELCTKLSTKLSEISREDSLRSRQLKHVLNVPASCQLTA